MKSGMVCAYVQVKALFTLCLFTGQSNIVFVLLLVKRYFVFLHCFYSKISGIRPGRGKSRLYMCVHAQHIRRCISAHTYVRVQ